MLFTLDNSTLGGRGTFAFHESIIADRGRSISLQWTQDGLDETFGLTGYSIRYASAETEPKEDV